MTIKMDLAQFGEVLNKVSHNEANKENVPPRAPTAPREQPTQSNDQRVSYPWGWLRKQIPYIQDAVIKFSTDHSLVNAYKFWEIDSDTYVVEHDYINTFIAKITLYQAMFLSQIQIPAIIILVPSSDEQFKLLFRISTFLAKHDDLSPCVFHLQIQPETAPKPPDSALHAHKHIVSLILINAPLLPKSVLIKMREFLVALEVITENNSANNPPPNPFTE